MPRIWSMLGPICDTTPVLSPPRYDRKMLIGTLIVNTNKPILSFRCFIFNATLLYIGQVCFVVVLGDQERGNPIVLKKQEYEDCPKTS